MIDPHDGQSAIVVARMAPAPRRRAISLPTISILREHPGDPVFVVSGETRHAGRDTYVNLLASTMTRIGYVVVIIEIGSVMGAAATAHKAAGIAVHLVDPARPVWYVDLIDLIDQHAGQCVIISVPFDRWLDFARVEAAVLASIVGLRPIGYVFVDPSGRGARLALHLEWLARKTMPAVPHLLVLRGREINDRTPALRPDHAFYSNAPFMMPQIAEAMSGRHDGDVRRFSTFDQAWEAATTGTRAVMLEQVKTSLRDIGDLLDACARSFREER